MSNKLEAMRPQKKIELFSGTYFAACTIGGVIACGPTHTMVTPLDLVSCGSLECVLTMWMRALVSPTTSLLLRDENFGLANYFPVAIRNRPLLTLTT
jgi:hypothetical protein